MTVEIGLLLAIVLAALVLFSFEWVPVDVTALGVLLLLVLGGLLPADRAFAGFGSDPVILILGLLILTVALERTGIADLTGRAILRRTGEDPRRLLLAVMVAAAVLSSAISNTAATAFFLPIAVGIAARARVSPSRMLLPLAFASILTSSVTLVSTSTNILVSGLMTRHRLEPIGMFELAPVGVPIAAAGLAYMWWIGRRLLPERAEPGGLAGPALRPYLSEVLVRPDSPLAGRTVAEADLGRELDLTVLSVVRGERRLFPRPDLELQAEDVLLVEGRREDILKVKDRKGIDIRSEVKLSLPDLDGEKLGLAEVILLPGSPLIGRTLRRSRFRQRYGLQVLAINRGRETLHGKLSEVMLRLGDVLLVQGDKVRIATLEEEHLFRVLEPLAGRRGRQGRAPFAVLGFLGALAIGTLGLMSFPVAAMVGVLFVFLAGCVNTQEAYRDVDWKVIVLIASMLGLGTAVEETGTARFLARGVVELGGEASPLLVLSGFFFLTVLLSQPMSNQAAAAVVLPVALRAAEALALNPRTFAVMVAVAASTSYMTPLEPACLMVYTPGRYRFSDFLKVGTPLTLLVYALSILLVPVFWPLR